MANGYRMNNLIKGKQSSISIGASETDTVITDDIIISAEDSKNIAIRIKIDSTATAREVTGISFSLQHSPYETTWEDVGTQADVALASTLATVVDADISSTNDTITSTSHPFSDNDAVYYVSSATNVITGLTDNTVYYVTGSTANTFKVSLTEGGSAIDITAPSGGDTHYFTKVEDLEIILNIENSSDEAQLPLFPKARVVANSGASDAISVSGVYVSRRL